MPTVGQQTANEFSRSRTTQSHTSAFTHAFPSRGLISHCLCSGARCMIFGRWLAGLLRPFKGGRGKELCTSSTIALTYPYRIYTYKGTTHSTPTAPLVRELHYTTHSSTHRRLHYIIFDEIARTRLHLRACSTSAPCTGSWRACLIW